MIHPGKGTNTVRTVFIIDPNGIIRAILYYPQELGRNLDEILRMIKGLQTSDKYGVAIPANWPNNEIIGDKVILPPAEDEKTAKERLEKAKTGEKVAISIEGGIVGRNFDKGDILYTNVEKRDYETLLELDVLEAREKEVLEEIRKLKGF